VQEVFKQNNIPDGVSCLVIGDREVGELMANDPRVALVSATGSTRMGKAVASAVAARLGKSLLELAVTMLS
jgi:aldehyde dehydrogenase (NAD+)